MNDCNTNVKTIESQALNQRMPFSQWIDTRNNLNNQRKNNERDHVFRKLCIIQRFGGAERTTAIEYVSFVRTRTISLVYIGQRVKLIKSVDVLFIFARSVCLTFEQYFV